VTGTCFEYNLAARRQPIIETSRTAPASTYARSKLLLFKSLRDITTLTWVRLFYQYGPAENPNRLVPFIIGKLLRGEKCRLSTGDQVRDFLHVSDVGRALGAVFRDELLGVVNIGSSQPVTVRQVAETIGKLMERSELLEFGVVPPRPGDPPYVVADTVRLRSTGWEPKFTLTSGLEQTIEWWQLRLRRST
jgi:nucleoside-diphosphate-sugar epimerase